MDLVRAVLAAAALMRAVPAAADPVDRWTVHIEEASARFGVPSSWIRKVIRAESGGATEIRGAPVVSSAGAMGLMQLMPSTWREMRQVLRLGADPHHPRDNILAGSLYLRLMFDRFGYPGLFAAYNAGPARYAQYLSGRRALPYETRAYVAKLAPAASVTGTGRAQPLRPGPALQPEDPPGLFARAPLGSLFVPLGRPAGR